MNKLRDKVSHQPARLINTIGMAKLALRMPLNAQNLHGFGLICLDGMVILIDCKRLKAICQCILENNILVIIIYINASIFL